MEHSVSALRTSIRSLDTSRTKRCITGEQVSRTNFVHYFGSTVWNTTRNTPLGNYVPPVRGLVVHTITVPPLPRWATFFRPWRDSQTKHQPCSHSGGLHEYLQARGPDMLPKSRLPSSLR